MHTHSWIPYSALIPSLLSSLIQGVSAENWHRHDPNLFHFASRPDLRPPKWEVKIYDRERLSEGYWFVAPKPGLDPTWGSAQSWWGPVIYDIDGELIWSGASQFDTPNIMGFQMSYVDGENQLTMLDRDRATGTVVNSNYDITNIIYLAEQDSVNGHELNFVEGGTTVLHITNDKLDATQEEKDAVGFKGAECVANYNGIKERDVKTGEVLFEWSPHGHIKLNESTESADIKIDERCNTWDFIHANSVDKTPDGDYIFSARHCDAIYKISHLDGSIIWRLGGKQSDFEVDDNAVFSRQHNIRSQGQNETHELISILDNAKGEDSQVPSHDFSRGLIIALERDDTKPRRASLVAHYDEPRAGYAQRRGNMQVMEGGNVFMGWSERALQSEHSPDGTLLMEAIFAVDWFGSYRNYKFPFVGRPNTDPDVKAIAYMQDDKRKNNPSTHVYVSWNGDTEVRTWKLSGSTDAKDNMSEISSAGRKGFETSFRLDTYYKYISLQGLDKDGNVLGETGVVRTEQHPSAPTGKEDTESGEATYVVCKKPERQQRTVADPVFIFLLSFACATGAFLLTWFGILPLLRSRRLPFSRASRARGFTARREEQQYNKVSPGDFDLDDDDDESDQKLPFTETDSSSHSSRTLS